MKRKINTQQAMVVIRNAGRNFNGHGEFSIFAGRTDHHLPAVAKGRNYARKQTASIRRL